MKLLLFLFLSLNAFASPKEITLNTWIDDSKFVNLQKKNQLIRLIKLAFKKTGHKVKIHSLPAERSLVEANKGHADGEFIRVQEIEKFYKNLVKVPQELIVFKFVAFSKNEYKIEKWSDLDSLKTGIIIGWKILEQNIKNTKNRIERPTPEKIIHLLDTNRIDVFVYSEDFGKYKLKEMKIKNIKKIGQPLAVRNMYLFLHKKNKKLIPKLMAAFKELKEHHNIDIPIQ